MAYADPRINPQPTLAQVIKQRDKLCNDLIHLRAAGGQWIACAERLPDCPHEDNDGMLSQSVLVCDENAMPSLALGHMREGGTWELYGGDSDCMHPTTITHWMPWPRTPKQQAEAASLGREHQLLMEAGSLEAAVALYKRVLSEQVDALASGRLDADTYRRCRERWETALLRATRGLSRDPVAPAGEVQA